MALEDAGSSYGTWLDGRRLDGRGPLRDGSRIRMGNQELIVERRRDEAEAGTDGRRAPGDSLVVPGAAPARYPQALRSGYALKRLEASEGPRRWVLSDLESDRFLRMSDADAELFELLDGRHSLAELVREAEQRSGADGPGAAGAAAAELAERGLLAGVQGAGGGPGSPAAGCSGSPSRGRRPGTARGAVRPALPAGRLAAAHAARR